MRTGDAVRARSNATLVLISVLVSLLFVECVLRVIDYPKDMLMPLRCAPFSKLNSYMGSFSNAHASYPPYAVIPVCSHEFSVFGIADGLGYLGIRQQQTEKEWPLLVFGDSFAYGFGVEQSETFAHLLGGYNAGLWGQSFPVHARAFELAVVKLKPSQALWVLYPPHLITVTPDGWQGKKIDAAAHPLLHKIVEAFNKTFLSDLILKAFGWGYNKHGYYTLEWSLYDEKDSYEEVGYSVFEEAVKNVMNQATTFGVQIIPVFMPSQTQLSLKLERNAPVLITLGRTLDPDIPIKRMADILRRNGIPLEEQINLEVAFSKASWRKLYFDLDAHLNRAGHKFAADYIQGQLSRISGLPPRIALSKLHG